MSVAVQAPIDQTPEAPRVPFEVGLTIVSAIATREGDYESIKRVAGVSSGNVHIVYSGETPPSDHGLGEPNAFVSDLRGAHWYATDFARGPQHVTTASALGTSSLVLEELRDGGMPAFAWSSPTKGDLTGTLRRADPKDVMVPVILNDRATMLPAIHANAFLAQDGSSKDGDFYFLDDPQNPIALRWKIGKTTHTVTKISYPSGSSAALLSQDLVQEGRAEIYGIYFESGGVAIRPESKMVLDAIAQSLRRNPVWKLRIEGHTDDLGGAEHNFELSRKRADAVKEMLESAYGVEPERLWAVGYGQTSPKDHNNTLEGRARNRRVELVRE